MRYLLLTLICFLCLSQTVWANNAEMLDKKYLPIFEEIEFEAINRLNQLIDEAYVEYGKKKEKGELTLPILFSYIEKGQQLEVDVDLAFQEVLAQLKTEIKELGVDESFVAPYEQRYLKSKRSNKFKILKNITLEGHTINFERNY